MMRVHLPILTENTWKIFIAAVIRTWYGKTMAHNTATKHARVKTLNLQVARKLSAVEKALADARDLLYAIHEQPGFTSEEKMAGAELVRQLVALGVTVARAKSYSIADVADDLASDKGHGELATYVLTPTGYEHESTYPVPAPPPANADGFRIPRPAVKDGL